MGLKINFFFKNLKFWDISVFLKVSIIFILEKFVSFFKLKIKINQTPKLVQNKPWWYTIDYKHIDFQLIL
jgi:hypothetical protein